MGMHAQKKIARLADFNMRATARHEDIITPSGSHKIPINKYHEHRTSQKGVLLDHGSNWHHHLEPFIPDPTQILRLVKNPSFSWKPGTTEVLGVLQHIPKVPSSVYQQMREALQAFHDSGPQSSTKSTTHDKRSGSNRPSPHIGFWAKGSPARNGKAAGYPWVTKDTTHVTGATLQHLQIICNLLRDNFNNFIMNILRVQDPKLWLRMQLYVSILKVK
ncbi:hypothetical protein BS47DRAFT_845709 [Hydnum rufescens UP504]|uniref:Uncharacterized protein n=1 Tax=Hydnum rufescens UP504 TaxID=1448309 RepID=A0A9P6DZ35_9AGAM|nr:hypothetical protein BS47DRAFT_845709 [Hydnum rufescens UP504]